MRKARRGISHQKEKILTKAESKKARKGKRSKRARDKIEIVQNVEEGLKKKKSPHRSHVINKNHMENISTIARG